jgi:hypothetical protein
VTGVPPLPAVTETVTCVSPATPVGVAGTPGGPGTTLLDAAEALDVPIELVAVEVKV